MSLSYATNNKYHSFGCRPWPVSDATDGLDFTQVQRCVDLVRTNKARQVLILLGTG